jgi:methyl-accepting chemotaxis protein WspA
MQWFANLSISRKLLFSFLALIAIMISAGGFTLLQLGQINDKAKQIIDGQMPAIGYAGKMKNHLWRYHATGMLHVLSAEPADKARLEQQMSAIHEDYKKDEAEYVKLIGSPVQQRLYDNFKSLLVDYLAEYQRVLKLSRENDPNAAAMMVRGESTNKIVANISNAIDALVDGNLQSGREIGEEGNELLAETFKWILGMQAFAALFGIAAAIVIARFMARSMSEAMALVNAVAEGDLTGDIAVASADETGQLARAMKNMQALLKKSLGQLQKAGMNATTTATEMNAAMRQQEASVAEQAATANETAASVKEIAATAKELSDNMDEIVHVAEETSRRAAESQQGLNRLDQTMRQMVEASNAIVSKLAVLNEKAGNINTVVTTIAKVADQTNLLSLNAAIEAEKAGEYGLGFSVVATEIRRLADQTAVATYDIEQILKEMQSAVSASVMGMDKFSDEIRRNAEDVRQIGERMSEVIEQIQALTPRFESVFQGMQSQFAGAEQINQSMAQFNESMQQTVESIRNSKQSIGLLTEAVQDVQNVVRQFKVGA